MPKKPIISTWAGTEELPANWASLCIRPMVSVAWGAKLLQRALLTACFPSEQYSGGFLLAAYLKYLMLLLIKSINFSACTRGKHFAGSGPGLVRYRRKAQAHNQGGVFACRLLEIFNVAADKIHKFFLVLITEPVDLHQAGDEGALRRRGSVPFKSIVPNPGTSLPAGWFSFWIILS